MRQIRDLANMLASVLLNKTPSAEIIDEDGTITEDDLLRMRLERLIGERKINEAENLLYAYKYRIAETQFLKSALWFYNEINRLDDAELESADYSRQEIFDGLNDLKIS